MACTLECRTCGFPEGPTRLNPDHSCRAVGRHIRVRCAATFLLVIINALHRLVLTFCMGSGGMAARRARGNRAQTTSKRGSSWM